MWHKRTFPQKRKSWTWRIDLWLPRGRWREWKDWELGVNRCKLLLLEWTNNEILLYNTENYIYILTMQHDNGRKNSVYMYV